MSETNQHFKEAVKKLVKWSPEHAGWLSLDWPDAEEWFLYESIKETHKEGSQAGRCFKRVEDASFGPLSDRLRLFSLRAQARAIPKPELLLAMKLNSALRRDKENKRIKDVADIYALLWHSDTHLPELKNQLFSINPKEETRKTIRTFTQEDIDKVSKTIGVTTKEISRVLAQLK